MLTSFTTSLVLVTVLGFLALLLQALQISQHVGEKQWAGSRRLQRRQVVSEQQRSQRSADDIAPQLLHEPRNNTSKNELNT